mgnify:CR=1 FL=1
MNDGMELADSYCTNPHKWMGVNFDCDLFYTADRAALLGALLGFVLFRAFDIVKPPPARQLERAHGGCELGVAGLDEVGGEREDVRGHLGVRDALPLREREGAIFPG